MPTREPASPTAVVRSRPWLFATAAALMTALLAVTLLGGWSRSTPEGAERVAIGTGVEVAPFRVRLDQATAHYVLHGRDAEPGQAFVTVEGQIELTVPASVTSTTVTDAFTADLTSSFDQYGSPTEEPEPGVRVSADGSNLLGLGPGLRYDVQVTFIVEEGSVPDQLTVTLREHTWRPSALDGQLGWFDAAPAARVTLDVAPLPATRPDPEGF